MVMNLKARLKHYHDNKKSSSAPEAKPAVGRKASGLQAQWPGWTEVGLNVIKREQVYAAAFPFESGFPKALAILVPDLVRFGRIPMSEDLLFFDLETTGLSGGAGTIAFIAAFGRFTAEKSGNAALTVTQYLLLDYPGESEFIESVAANFTPAGGGLPLVVSYNGKCFDSQILKNRCLLNRIRPPEYYQADLLHPSRRLWKNILSDCSQTTIEVQILGLDRTGDVSGAMAPEIWFSFLREGDNAASRGKLLSICDHNARDVAGLATLFLALGKIASDPFKSRDTFRFDDKTLALSWWKALKKHPVFFEDNESYTETAFSLLEAAAKNGSSQAAIVLAKDAEWRLRDLKLALHYTNLALAAAEITSGFRDEIEKRLERLERKYENAEV
jgi:uncharacterized protein YprB with RNaseH-like and TPR domain